MWVLDTGLTSEMAAVWNYASSAAHVASALVLTRLYRMPSIHGVFCGGSSPRDPLENPSHLLSKSAGSRNLGLLCDLSRTGPNSTPACPNRLGGMIHSGACFMMTAAKLVKNPGPQERHLELSPE